MRVASPLVSGDQRNPVPCGLLAPVAPVRCGPLRAKRINGNGPVPTPLRSWPNSSPPPWGWSPPAVFLLTTAARSARASWIAAVRRRSVWESTTRLTTTAEHSRQNDPGLRAIKGIRVKDQTTSSAVNSAVVVEAHTSPQTEFPVSSSTAAIGQQQARHGNPCRSPQASGNT